MSVKMDEMGEGTVVDVIGSKLSSISTPFSQGRRCRNYTIEEEVTIPSNSSKTGPVVR